MRLHQYDITIVYKKGTEMLIADTLSRHHLDHTTDKAQGDEEVDSLGTINEILLCESTVTTLRDHTASDAELQLVQSFIQSGWPATSKDLDPTIVPYFHVRDELAIQDNHFQRRPHRNTPTATETNVERLTCSTPRHRIHNSKG